MVIWYVLLSPSSDRMITLTSLSRPKPSYEILKGNNDEGPFSYYGSGVLSSPPQHDDGSNRGDDYRR